jgi:TRAP-type C4-dicarboxylate transport system permease small subunit
MTFGTLASRLILVVASAAIALAWNGYDNMSRKWGQVLPFDALPSSLHITLSQLTPSSLPARYSFF